MATHAACSAKGLPKAKVLLLIAVPQRGPWTKGCKEFGAPKGDEENGTQSTHVEETGL